MKQEMEKKLDKYSYLLNIMDVSDNKSFVADLRFRPLRTNDAEFFLPDFCLTDYTEQLVDLPVKRERIITVNYQGTLYSTTVYPLADGVEVFAYVVIMRDYDQMMNYVENSGLSEIVCHATRVMQQNLSQIINLAGLMESDFQKNQLSHELTFVQKQIDYCVKLLGQFTNLTEFFDNSTLKPSENLIDLNQILKAIISECKTVLSTVDRNINVAYPDDAKLVNVNQKRFTVVFMNLLQNALLYSPKKSDVDITLSYDKGNAHIAIKNRILNDLSDFDVYERPGMGKRVAKKLFREMNGEITFTEKSGIMTVEITVPTIEYLQSTLLGARFADYITERYKPVHTYLNEIVENEKMI